MNENYQWGINQEGVLVDLPYDGFTIHQFFGSRPNEALVKYIYNLHTNQSNPQAYVLEDEEKPFLSSHSNEVEDEPKTQLRPTHYTKGSDTFAWAEERFNPNELRAIAEFNIHKYLNRLKGEDIKDFGKIADYALWIKGIKEKDKEC